MDVARPYRTVSILNNDTNPAFTYRVREAGQPTKPTLPSLSSIALPSRRRPSLTRQRQFARNRSTSPIGSPPLLRNDSSNSASSYSNRSMDNSPSPSTPAYLYDSALPPLTYDAYPQQYLDTSTGITPFLEQGLISTPLIPTHVTAAKAVPRMPLIVPAVATPLSSMYSAQAQFSPQLMGMPVSVVEPTSPMAQASPTASIATTAPMKKNKYPCPFASTHNCTASFTTSGHAARHGKKHTGEKNVQCPVCKKAFTRKDNMKQHERTHRSGTQSSARKSKAQITREAQKEKEDEEKLALITPASAAPTLATEGSSIPSIPSMITETSDPSEMSMPLNAGDIPMDLTDPAFFPNPAPPNMSEIARAESGPLEQTPSVPELTSSESPSTSDPTLSRAPASDDSTYQLVQKTSKDISLKPPPGLNRGFSDLDTLAIVAENANDPYFQLSF